MKKLSLILILSCLSAPTFALTCPPAKRIISGRDGHYPITAPVGWLVAQDNRHSDSQIEFKFSRAVWGPAYTVTCQYYTPELELIALETTNIVQPSQITSHAEWRKGKNSYACESPFGSVQTCPFA